LRVLLLFFAALGQIVSANAAPTLAVYTHSEGEILPLDAFQSIIWHELQHSLEHNALFVDRLDVRTVDLMRRNRLTSLLEMHVTWKVDVIRLQNGGVVGGYFPTIETTEWSISGQKLEAQTKWQTVGNVSLFQVKEGPTNEYIAIPELALQNAVDVALQPVEAPTWKHQSAGLNVPVAILADEEYRAFYGDDWKKTAQLRIARANAILEPTGIHLDIERFEGWRSKDSRRSSLSKLLDNMAVVPRRDPREIRVGFTQQTQLAAGLQRNIEDVGRAHLPGRDLIIADQALAPGHKAKWDIAEEGVVIAHEVLHAFGIPHQNQPFRLMAGSKTGTVHRLSESTIALAKSAVSARYTHWDRVAALNILSNTASQHLQNSWDQINYIADNLNYGPGVPAPGTLQPSTLSALTNLALGHFYLRMAKENPGGAINLARGALVHSESALKTKPNWVPASQLREAVQNFQETTIPESILHLSETNESGGACNSISGFRASSPTCD